MMKLQKTHIGKLIGIDQEAIERQDDTAFPYLVKFEEILPTKDTNTMNFDRGEIEKFAPTKWALENLEDISKYNL